MQELNELEKRALDEQFAELYLKVKELASRVRWHGVNPTLNPTALVHEAYLKLVKSRSTVGSRSYEDVIGIFASAMRQILIDASRRRQAQKRAPVVALESTDFPLEDALTLATLVDSLRQENARRALVVDCRFYLGMTVSETAAAMGISTASVEREWREARAYLNIRLHQKGAASGSGI